jgi:hypothetical protein
VRQLLLPLAPLKIAVGTADRLELHAPFTARALFGDANGLLQTAVDWTADRGLVTTNLSLALRNIQASAIGIDYGTGHSAIVEDEMDGDISMRTDKWPVDRDSLSQLRALQPSNLDKVSLAVDFRKTARSKSTPGVLQLSSDAQVNVLNDILNRIIRDLQLAVPPRSASYGNFVLNFHVENGRVATKSPWLVVDGIQIFSSPFLDLDSTVRLHGSRNGEALELRDVLNLLNND